MGWGFCQCFWDCTTWAESWASRQGLGHIQGLKLWVYSKVKAYPMVTKLLTCNNCSLSYTQWYTHLPWLYTCVTIFGNIVKSLHLASVRIQGSGWAKSHLNTTIPRIAFFLLYSNSSSFISSLQPSTKQANVLPCIFVPVHTAHILRETKARGPFGAALISLTLCLPNVFAICSRVPAYPCCSQLPIAY